MRTRLTTVLAFILAASALAAPAAFAAGGGKIGVIDTQKVLGESTAGVEVQAKLKTFYEKQHKWVQDQQSKLEKEEADLQKNKDVMAKDAYQKQQGKLQADYQQYQQEYQKRQQEFQQLQKNLMKPLDASLYNVVQTYAKRNGFDLIIDKRAVIYNEDAVDVTEAVLKAFNVAEPHAPAPATSSQ